MSAYIILENVPEERARIDLSSYQVPNEFIGFRDVPYGLHYVSIITQNNTHSFWYYLRSEQILVKFFHKITDEFEDREAEVAAHYQKRLALGFITEEQLIPYNHKRSGSWLLLTSGITPKYFPVTLHTSQQGKSSNVPSPTDWEKEVFETHQGNFYSFIAEFQFAFVRWYVSDLDSPTLDVEAFNRWKYLVEAICNSDIPSLAKASELVDVVASALTSQFDSLEDSLLPANDPLVDAARLLQEKMLNGEIPYLLSQGRKLKKYLDERYENFG